MGVEAGLGRSRTGICPGYSCVVESLFRPFWGGFRGLKPRIISASNAALKRRSSTVLLVSVVLLTCEAQG